jgi:hypothetical protein
MAFLAYASILSRAFLREDSTLRSYVQWIHFNIDQRFRKFCRLYVKDDRLCGLAVRALGYRSGGPGSIPGTIRKKVVGLERGPLSLVSTTVGAT